MRESTTNMPLLQFYDQSCPICRINLLTRKPAADMVYSFYKYFSVIQDGLLKTNHIVSLIYKV